jgi:hypothetical protein
MLAGTVSPRLFEGETSTQNMKTSHSESSIHLENIVPKPPNQGISGDEILPTDSPQDPRNWSPEKKNAQILMVAFHSMMGTFMAAGIIPAYDALAEEYSVTVPDASYLTSFQVCNLE